MALTQRSKPTVGTTLDGFLQVKISLQTLSGTTVVGEQYHRTSIPPGWDVSAQMSAVNAHLAQMGNEPVSDSDIAQIAAHASVAWTPEIVAAYQARIAAEAANTKGA